MNVSMLLREYAEARSREAARTAPDPTAEVAALVAAVRRRRAVRAGGVVSGAVAAVVAGALAVHGGSPPVLPAEPTPRTSVAPTPAPGALPEAPPVTDGMLEAAGPGWSLVTYVAAPGPDDAGHEPGAPAGLYLMDPRGELHRVPTDVALTADAPWLDAPMARLVDWLPGTTLVLMVRGLASADAATGHVVVDLRDGRAVLELDAPQNTASTVTFVKDGTTDLLIRRDGPLDEYPGSAEIARVRLDGTTVALVEPFEGSSGVLSQDGTLLAVGDRNGGRVLDAGTLAEVRALPAPPGTSGGCLPAGWLGHEALLFCGSSDDGYGTLWLDAVDGVRDLTGPVVENPRFSVVVGDHLVVLDYRGDLTSVARDGSTRSLPDPGLLLGTGTVAGGRVVVHAGDFSDTSSRDVVAVDPFTGDRTVLLRPAEGAVARAVTIPDGAVPARP